jgi:hypothetical protein
MQWNVLDEERINGARLYTALPMPFDILGYPRPHHYLLDLLKKLDSQMHVNKLHNSLRKYTSEYLFHVINYVKSDCRTILSNKQTLPGLRNFKLGNFRQGTRNFNQI